LVTWNGAKYLPFLFDSLRRQTFTDFDVIVVDNASTDTTVAIVEKELVHMMQPHEFIKKTLNTGFAGGHNQAFGLSQSEYVVLINQDVCLTPDCFEKLVAVLDKYADASAVSPRLMRWNFDASVKRKLEDGFTNSVDSLGLQVLRNRRVIERGGGEDWVSAQEPSVQEVFGVSGALPLLRRSYLAATLLPESTVFDPHYGMYKEDVDLAFRLRLAGYRAYVCLNTVAYHDRTALHGSKLGDMAAAQGKGRQSDFVAYYSYKNHLATLYKNELWQNLTLDFLAILWYETKKFGFYMLFRPRVLKGLVELWKERRSLRESRCKIQASKKVSWKKMRKWWTSC
jgi:GT2 family glycosyltransferase